ncbi:hypothetical protein [Roseovarius sp.]|uniref:hypothetical protein n=1 Tax=Roseovarius sp. TaxID=1486281 RepID=UPI000C3A07C0|nr:hypothetical protein [Roseovarius sp.]MAO26877.1 hypothetical protein [Roseovarius sp.]MAZ20240.1 hypothetical protein [Roseovarius sp.]|tara:strand:+ start:7187 stop:7573 length:387 start_codon:yes stop_codon:yes gene_type:complete
MTSFKALPNKRAVSGDEAVENLWPELGDEIELNQFYNRYDGAEGWLGEGYLAIWTRQEIEDFQGQNLQAYPTTYRFFASDGGGTQFGFFAENGRVSYVSAPDIGGEEDVRVLGNWAQFLELIAAGDYI